MDETRLIFIRHGESASNAGGWISGHATCGGLTERGRVQAQLLQRRLAGGAEPDVVLSSTMRRAMETAQIVAGDLDLEVEAHEDLSERLPGECEGMTLEEYFEKYGRHAWADWDIAMSPGGETNDEFVARVDRIVQRIAEEHRGRTVWIVCHGGIIMSTAALFMTRDRPLPRFQNPANASVSEWRRGWNGDLDGPWLLHRYNDHGHIDVAEAR